MTNPFLEDGIYAATLTPLHDDLSCNAELLVHHCQDLIQRRCKGVVLFGTTSEGSSFSLDEKKDVINKCFELGLNFQQVIIGNASSSIQDTVDLCRLGIEKECLAFLISPPCFYTNVREEGVIAYYREIINRVNNPRLQILLYHIPQYTGVALTLPIVQKLREEFSDTIIGIKESEGNFEFTKELLKNCLGFKIFVGNEKHIADAVNLGAAGSICGICNLYPEFISSLYERGKNQYASPSLLEELYAVIKAFPFIAVAKALMEEKQRRGWNRVRPPLVTLTTDEIKSLILKIKPVEESLESHI